MAHVLLPLTVVYTAAALVAEPSWALFVWSTVAAAGVTSLVVILTRRAIPILFTRRRGDPSSRPRDDTTV